MAAESYEAKVIEAGQKIIPGLTALTLHLSELFDFKNID